VLTAHRWAETPGLGPRHSCRGGSRDGTYGSDRFDSVDL